ncbi:1,4-alpha-glucan (glycogen) branching enzyme, GH-13-type [Labilithrix luteola]|uniref:1,4-alpha-glucan branching enzyme n=1 Tax=Labilithrix luteola TaxID=1391654 RepID=A0A0K1Q4I7_9BACT|nr:1,4-alpha-glucan branching protein GlgB [Labilithrix luteola]AKV00721.1 1,4-alpha-glucan (glycogen) branching enzyme, GH-13-type [Labilithrix luteola]
MIDPRSAEVTSFAEGKAIRAHRFLGAHPDLKGGTTFGVWAPRASEVWVVGTFPSFQLSRLPGSNVFCGHAANVPVGSRYAYRIVPADGGSAFDKADPYGLAHESAPGTSSIVTRLEHSWHDDSWLERRRAHTGVDLPMSIYEVHLGSWLRVPEESQHVLSYRDIAAPLAEYARKMGFTHVELMPLLEHPFYGSWGYGVTGFFAATSRYGSAADLMYLVDVLHQQGLGVIFDWVPAHFALDPHGLGRFDGEPLYEPEDPADAVHAIWRTGLFDFDRPEVRSFLLSSAMFWIETFHADGLRVDGVEAILYRDHGKTAANSTGTQRGRENTRGVSFLRELTRTLKLEHPDVCLIAEDSSAWPGVTRSTTEGGLGFDFKWDIGFSHDMRRYLAMDPLFRSEEQALLTFRSVYATNENFVLSLSHDDVAPDRGGALLEQMYGDAWQKLANVRLLLTSAYAQPGKKLLFMGDEFAEPRAWNHDRCLDWHVARLPAHEGVARMVRDLNRMYREHPALHTFDRDANAGFEWVDNTNAPMSVIAFARKGRQDHQYLVVAMNFTPVPRYQYRIGVPKSGPWVEIFNTDARDYDGSGQGNLGRVEAVPYPWNDRRFSIVVTLPPLGAVFLEPARV